jgi:glycosyltransferase involved in cell wall biosynthesis
VRVLHIGKFYPPHPGGIERCVADLCSALSRDGVDVAALAHAEPGAAGRQIHDPAGFDVSLAACHGQLLYAPVSPSFPFLLSRILREFRPDLLHIHLPNTSAFFCLLLPAARRVPWVVHWHADIPLDSKRRSLRAAYAIYRPWERTMLRRAAAVIATSAPYRDSSAALAPWLAKTHVIALGVAPLPSTSPLVGEVATPARAAMAHATAEPSTARTGGAGAAVTLAHTGDLGQHSDRSTSPVDPRPSTHTALRILSVGRLSYFKGIDVLLRAIALVPAARLQIVGDGECRAALERLTQELGIESRVRFAGRIDMDAAGAAVLQAAYADAEVFCLPSTDRAESFGIVLLEAMRARLPVIASAIPGSGVNYVVQAGETGLLVPPGDVAALASALRRLAADHILRDELGASGERRWRDAFTLDCAAKRTLELYRHLLLPTAQCASATPPG